MKGSTVWKFVLTALLLVWSIAELTPLEDQPDFKAFILEQASDNRADLERLIARAEKSLEAGEARTLYLALRQQADAESTDLQAQFFPHIEISPKNLERKNASILKVLNQRSKANLRKGLDLAGGTAFTLRIDESLDDPRAAEARLEEAVEIIRARVDGLGVSEPVIRPEPPNRLEVQMPGLNLDKDPEAAEAITKAARLDFREVWRGTRFGSVGAAPPDAVVGSFERLKTEPWNPNSPEARYEVMVLESENPTTGEILQDKLYVKAIPAFSGEVEDAAAVISQTGGFEVSIDFTGKGGDAFGELTRQIDRVDRQRGNKGRLAIVLDGKLYSAPPLAGEPGEPNRAITGGRASISGQFSQREAVELANVLNNPLAFDLVIDDMSLISPQLAEDARQASVNAAILGAVLVVAFMIAYYVSAGIVAVVSTMLNVVVILGVLASIGATLTLPGVAAVVLTIGMAVDANILIFERIREEQQNGKTLGNALVAGYQKAFSTIIDANVSTLITALILYYLGTGPVKGFGITLAIGIGASVFGALVISRAFLETLIGTGLVKKLIPRRFDKPFDFVPMAFRQKAFIASWCIVAAGIGGIITKGADIFGIDFRGGAEVTFNFDPEARDDLSITTILEVAQRENLGEVQPTFEQILGQDIERLTVQVDAEQGRIDQVENALRAAFPEAGLEKASQSLIGPSVSESIRWNAVTSVVVALVGILLYVALRFEVGFGVGAVVATIHDVLMTVGIYVLLGMIGIGSGQFSAPMVAAILMIVGYSINDTIVVFDRIREELELRPDMTLFDIINLAVNRTLSRTLLTSVTTLFAATSLFVFGAGVIQDYSLVFIIGILTGTFSSIFIASPVFFWWHKGSRQHVEEREQTARTYEWEIGGTKEKAKT